MSLPTIQDVEAGLRRVCESETLGAKTRGYAPSCWITTASTQPGRTKQNHHVVMKHLRQLEKQGIAEKVRGTVSQHGYTYSKWWHTAIIKPLHESITH